jgi:hypothetical protein
MDPRIVTDFHLTNGAGHILLRTLFFCAATAFSRIVTEGKGSNNCPTLLLTLKKLWAIAKNDVMQQLYKNENLLFKDFQDFLRGPKGEAILVLRLCRFPP